MGADRGVFFTLDVLQLIALPSGGSLWAGGHSGQEPTLEPGPHPQDAHTQWPKAVISQPELNSDFGVNLNQTLPHGGQEGRYFFSGNQLISSWKPASQGRYRGKGWKTDWGKGFLLTSSHGSSFTVSHVLEKRMSAL